MGMTTEPALQRAHARNIREFGVELPQAQPEVGRAPGRMLLVQEQGLLHRAGRRRRRRPRIGGAQRGFAVAVKGAAPAADRAGRQSEALGNERGRLVLAPQEEGAFPVSERQGCRHGKLPEPTAGEQLGKNTTIPLPAANRRVAISGQT